MSKSKIEGVPTGVPNVSLGYGTVISGDVPNRIVGRIIGIIEALGLTDKQEDSVKSLITNAVWDVFQDGVSITPERHTEIRELYYQKRRECGPEEPMSAI